MSKNKILAEHKIVAVHLYLCGKKSQHQIADSFSISLAAFQDYLIGLSSLNDICKKFH